MPLAVEVQHDIDEMFEHARPGDRAVLGDVPDDQSGDAALLRDRDERGRDGAHLGYRARGAVDRAGRNGLYRVDDEQPRLHLVDVGEQRAQVVLGGQEEPGVVGAGALGAQAHLGGGLLAGDDERSPVATWAKRCATSSSRVDLPTPGSPASSTTEPATSPPPSTRSSSPTPVGRARASSGSSSAIGRAGRWIGPGAAEGALVEAPTSPTVPHAWHSGQRPTQRTDAVPHSAQR